MAGADAAPTRGPRTWRTLFSRRTLIRGSAFVALNVLYVLFASVSPGVVDWGLILALSCGFLWAATWIVPAFPGRPVKTYVLASLVYIAPSLAVFAVEPPDRLADVVVGVLFWPAWAWMLGTCPLELGLSLCPD